LAIPVSSLQPAATSHVILAACGPTQHKGPHGGCVYNGPTASGCPNGKPRFFGRCWRH
jgi:hypothetical protein